jgi:hypothetical protein
MSLLKISVVGLLFYFLCGTMFLPEGDFSTLPDLPKMYTNCKTAEDPDMNLPDFITEHLLGVDGLFGQADNDDPNEKPHQPVQFHHQFMQFNFVARQFNIELNQPQLAEKKRPALMDEVYLSDYRASVFRPPIS